MSRRIQAYQKYQLSKEIEKKRKKEKVWKQISGFRKATCLVEDNKVKCKGIMIKKTP